MTNAPLPVVCESRDKPVPLPISEGAKRFNDALYKLHKLMKRWDELPPLGADFPWEDEVGVTGGVGVPNNSWVYSSVVLPQLNNGGSITGDVGNQCPMFVVDIQIVNKSKALGSRYDTA